MPAKLRAFLVCALWGAAAGAVIGGSGVAAGADPVARFGVPAGWLVLGVGVVLTHRQQYPGTKLSDYGDRHYFVIFAGINAVAGLIGALTY